MPGSKVDETVTNARDDDIGFVKQIEQGNSTSIQVEKEEQFMDIRTYLEATRLEGLGSASGGFQLGLLIVRGSSRTYAQEIISVTPNFHRRD